MLAGGLAAYVALTLGAAAPVGFARASSSFKSDRRPTLYQPLHLLDGRDATAWCAGAEGDGAGETITVGFKGVATIDALKITTGDAKDEATWKVKNRVRKLVVREERFTREIILADRREPQTYKFDPPIEAERLFFEIAEAYRGSGDAAPTCLSDIVFVSRGKALNGSFLGERLGYDRGRSQLMNLWTAGPEGSPEKFLGLYYDGTFRFRYVPLDPDLRGAHHAGEYRLEGRRLLVKFAASAWIDARLKRERIGRDDGRVVTRLVLKGEGLPRELRDTFVDLW